MQLSPTAISRAIRDGKYTAVEVLHAFQVKVSNTLCFGFHVFTECLFYDMFIFLACILAFLIPVKFF